MRGERGEGEGEREKKKERERGEMRGEKRGERDLCFSLPSISLKNAHGVLHKSLAEAHVVHLHVQDYIRGVEIQ